jgi:hypothetical protein
LTDHSSLNASYIDESTPRSRRIELSQPRRERFIRLSLLTMRPDALASLCIVLLAMMSTLVFAQTADIVATVVDEQGRPVEDAVVVAMPADGNVRLLPRTRVELVDQIDKEFRPRVKAIAVGTAVTFPEP